MMGSRNTVPPRMLRIVPLGERHIFLRPNSSTRSSSGVMVAHLTPTPISLIASAQSTVTLIVGGVPMLDAEVVVDEVDVQVGQDQLVLDPRPDDSRHLVAVDLDNGVGDLDFRHAKLSRNALWTKAPGDG